VLPAPADRVPGTFDQDVYIELLHRYHDAGAPTDGTVSFTLHAFLRAMGRRVDGRTYEQLRGALARLERTILESTAAYFVAEAPAPDRQGSLDRVPGRHVDERLTLLTAVAIDRRRSADRDQLALFAALTASEPGEARVTLSPLLRANIDAGYTTTLSAARYFALPSPTARRLYRLIAAVQAEATLGAGRDHAPAPQQLTLEATQGPPEAGRARGNPPGPAPVRPSGGGAIDQAPERKRPGSGASGFVWNVALNALAEQLPLSQRYPSHLQRVLEPAHAMLKAAGLVREATIRQQRRAWVVHYELP
jgi:hypothetical protein